jgi:MOSC domain-containing protein YiiM
MSAKRPTVVSVNISPGGIPKEPIQVGPVSADGIAGDGHNHEKHITPIQAICLIDAEDLDDLRAEGYDVGPGALGENLTVRDLDVDALAPGDRLRLSGGVELEYTKPRKPCYVLDAISPQLKEVVKGRCGGYAKVINPGDIRPGETIDVRHAAPDRT